MTVSIKRAYKITVIKEFERKVWGYMILQVWEYFICFDPLVETEGIKSEEFSDHVSAETCKSSLT